jgi:hypothetical protein
LDCACYEGRCNIRDHFGKSEWYSFLSDAWESYDDEITDENEHEYAATIAEDRGEELEVHSDRCLSWETRISQTSCPNVQTQVGTVFKKTKDGNFTPFEEVRLHFKDEDQQTYL